jgi:hypothetical protein
MSYMKSPLEPPEDHDAACDSEVAPQSPCSDDDPDVTANTIVPAATCASALAIVRDDEPEEVPPPEARSTTPDTDADDLSLRPPATGVCTRHAATRGVLNAHAGNDTKRSRSEYPPPDAWANEAYDTRTSTNADDDTGAPALVTVNTTPLTPRAVLRD